MDKGRVQMFLMYSNSWLVKTDPDHHRKCFTMYFYMLSNLVKYVGPISKLFLKFGPQTKRSLHYNINNNFISN